MDIVTIPGKAYRYKTTKDGLDIYLDVWPPTTGLYDEGKKSGPLTCPTFVYFHGGGLMFGNRNCFTPRWLFERITGLGYLFISADYRLLPPSTGHEIKEDVKDLWKFLTESEVVFELPVASDEKVDKNAIAVGGSSAGGFCAYLAAMHCTEPTRPKAVLSIYGMGGDIFVRYPLQHFPVLKEWLYPFEGTEGVLKEVADSPPLLPIAPSQSSNPSDGASSSNTTVTNPRIDATWLYLQLGVWLDIFTGEHEPSLSERLREICDFQTPIAPLVGEFRSASSNEEVKRKAVEAIPLKHRSLFPQFSVDESILDSEKGVQWPPVFFLHGTADTGVSILESDNLYALLMKKAVPVEIARVPGMEHNFDFEDGARERWKLEMNRAINFVEKWVGKGKEC
ncbi:alpha/beta-hydrolase [Coprinopsis marcescibilis]|uniref:Alpha/beta-hydrolase n=1 Tax=Coprinopsis marcescibilis TaxID=230819 RepID=A0A5C3KS71_COPMA|nr:alpha/beta-hydrolase [Coprinopsis marcescibilis]